MPPKAAASRPKQALVRFLSASHQPIGAGCLTTNGLIVTCAHVVRDALGVTQDQAVGAHPHGVLKLDFPFLDSEEAQPIPEAGSEQIRTAKVAPGGWGWMDPALLGNQDELHENDIAILKLVGEPPFAHGRIFTETYAGEHDLPLWLRGFPNNDPDAGPVNAALKARSELHKGLLTLDFEDSLYILNPGCSGAPVFRTDGHAAIGMFIGRPHHKAESHRDKNRIAYAVPAKPIDALLDAVLQAAAPRTVPPEFAGLHAYLPVMKTSLEQLNGAVNSAGPYVQNMERFLGHMEIIGGEKLGNANLAFLRRMIINLERQAEMAEKRGYDQHLTLFGLRDFCGKLRAVSMKLRTNGPDAGGTSAIPNDPLDEEKLPHWRELEVLKAEIAKRLDGLEQLDHSISPELRQRIRNELLLLRQELDLDPLYLHAIDSARAELEALDRSLFDVLIRQCQTLFGRYAERLPPGFVFRDFPEGPQMVVIPAGTFMMGSPKDEPERHADEGPQHEVTIANKFAMGRFTVSFDEWLFAVREGGCDGYEPNDADWGREDRPVINVSWDDARAYARWLSERTGKTYRLPSEAEWEYAARAGEPGPFSFEGKISTDKANYDGNYTYDGSLIGEDRGKTVPVGAFMPNKFGLYQVHGNVGEWCEDVWHESYDGAPDDGSAWLSGDESGLRVRRGGSWGFDPQGLRSAYRGRGVSDYRYDDIGFRLSRTLNP